MSRLRPALRAVLPSGVRRYARERALKRRYGLVSVGEQFEHAVIGTTFGKGCRLGGPVYAYDATIGDHTYIEVGCRISSADLGKFCAIAPYSLVGLAAHPTDVVSTHPLFYRYQPEFGYDLVDRDVFEALERTRIGNDVWIGAAVAVKDGITIGDGAVVGAGAVVTGDIPPYAIYAGVPARLIRYRFDEETIGLLLESRWWDRGDDWLRENADAFLDVDRFKRLLAQD